MNIDVSVLDGLSLWDGYIINIANSLINFASDYFSVLLSYFRDDLPSMPYLTMCIKEALRLHSPVPFIQRELTQDTDIDGHIAPAGTVINIVIYDIHHNPTVWEDSLVSCLNETH